MRPIYRLGLAGKGFADCRIRDEKQQWVFPQMARKARLVGAWHLSGCPVILARMAGERAAGDREGNSDQGKPRQAGGR